MQCLHSMKFSNPFKVSCYTVVLYTILGSCARAWLLNRLRVTPNNSRYLGNTLQHHRTIQLVPRLAERVHFHFEVEVELASGFTDSENSCTYPPTPLLGIYTTAAIRSKPVQAYILFQILLNCMRTLCMLRISYTHTVKNKRAVDVYRVDHITVPIALLKEWNMTGEESKFPPKAYLLGKPNCLLAKETQHQPSHLFKCIQSGDDQTLDGTDINMIPVA